MFVALSFEFLFALAVVYATSYFLIPLEKYGVPVLGAEIAAGMLFGSVFGTLNSSTPGFEFIASLAPTGLMLIMFDASWSKTERNPSESQGHD